MQDKWTGYFSALEEARQKDKKHRVNFTQGLLLIVAGFSILSLFIGIQYSAAIAFVTLFLVFNYGNNSKNLTLWISQSSKLSQDSQSVEKKIFDTAAQEVANWLNMEFQTAPVREPLLKSNLINGPIDFVNTSRCLTGIYNTSIAVCAAYMEVGKYEYHLDRNKKKQTTSTVRFQGLFIILDSPKLQANTVHIESDQLELLGWLASEWRQSQTKGYIRMENPEFEKYFHVTTNSVVDGYDVLSSKIQENLADFGKQFSQYPISILFQNDFVMALIPCKENPFAFRKNLSLWPRELSQFLSTVSLIKKFTESIHFNQNSSFKEVG